MNYDMKPFVDAIEHYYNVLENEIETCLIIININMYNIIFYYF